MQQKILIILSSFSPLASLSSSFSPLFHLWLDLTVSRSNHSIPERRPQQQRVRRKRGLACKRAVPFRGLAPPVEPIVRGKIDRLAWQMGGWGWQRRRRGESERETICKYKCPRTRRKVERRDFELNCRLRQTHARTHDDHTSHSIHAKTQNRQENTRRAKSNAPTVPRRK